MKTYCIVCKKPTQNANPGTVKNKGRLMMKSICPVCKIDLFQKDLVSLIV